MEFIDPGLVAEGLLMAFPVHLPLVLHGLLWNFQNRQAKQGGNFFTLLTFSGIILLLKILRRYFNEQ